MKYHIKKLMLIGLLSLCPVALQANPLQQKIEQAAQDGDVVTLKKLFRKLDRNKISPKERQEVVNKVLKTCGEIVDTGTKSFAFFNNWKDTARVIGGSLIGVYALSRVVHDMHLLRTGACEGCAGIKCQDNCICKADGCQRRFTWNCGHDKGFTKSPNAYSKVGYFFSSVPTMTLAAFGLQQLYKGLTSQSQYATYAGVKQIQELLEQKEEEEDHGA